MQLHLKFCASLKLFSSHEQSFGGPELLCDIKLAFSFLLMLKNAAKAWEGDS